MTSDLFKVAFFRYINFLKLNSIFVCRTYIYMLLFLGEVQADFYENLPIILRELLYRLNDEDKQVLKANHQALGVLSKHVPAEELVKHIDFIRNLIASMVSDARRRKGGVGDGEFLMPGFNIPKGEDIVSKYRLFLCYLFMESLIMQMNPFVKD